MYTTQHNNKGNKEEKQTKNNANKQQQQKPPKLPIGKILGFLLCLYLQETKLIGL
jgi:hypothetical protein